MCTSHCGNRVKQGMLWNSPRLNGSLPLVFIIHGIKLNVNSAKRTNMRLRKDVAFGGLSFAREL